MSSADLSRRQLTAFLPWPLRARIDAVRQQWDPQMAQRIGAHFTLCYDTRHCQNWDNGLDALVTAEPLSVRIGGAKHWGEPSAGIYLSVDDVRSTVSNARRMLSVIEPERFVYEPHVTITHPRTTAPEIASAAWAELQNFTVDEVVVIDTVDVIEFDGSAWRTVGTVRLG